MSYSKKISLRTLKEISFAKDNANTDGERALIEAFEGMFTEKEKAAVEYKCNND